MFSHQDDEKKKEACFDDCVSEVSGKVTRQGPEPISNSSELLAHGSDPNMMSLSSSRGHDGQLKKKKKQTKRQDQPNRVRRYSASYFKK